MNRSDLIQLIKSKRSFLCVGLDTDPSRIPEYLHSLPDPVYAFNKAIIEATKDYCVAYKPNIAFYESQGPAGWESLRKTIECIPPGHFTIADAKRGDIGNTSEMYAKTFFGYYDFDAVTVTPYMGSDSVKPFLQFPGKWAVLLALTSNEGAKDFQLGQIQGGTRVFEEVLRQGSQWGTPDNTMFVVGATRGELFADVRKLVPDHFLLVPGVGAQGGNLQEVCLHGMNKNCGLLVNSSRNIIYASSGTDFAAAAGRVAKEIQLEMDAILTAQGIF